MRAHVQHLVMPPTNPGESCLWHPPTELLGYALGQVGVMRPASTILSTSSGSARATMSAGSPSMTARAWRGPAARNVTSMKCRGGQWVDKRVPESLEIA
jgi:hypothetical protein